MPTLDTLTKFRYVVECWWNVDCWCLNEPGRIPRPNNKKTGGSEVRNETIDLIAPKFKLLSAKKGYRNHGKATFLEHR